MPTEKAPTDVNEPQGPSGTNPDPSAPAASEERRESVSASPVVRGSRWVDYDTHELLEMIGELEDERRFARLREGIWLAILIHLALLSAVTWIPRYVFKVPIVVDQSDALKQHKDFTYLDTPFQLPPKAPPKPLSSQQPLIDKQTMEAMKRSAPPAPAPEAAPKPAAPAAAPPPIPPSQQSQIEAPHPAAVPARPNFAMGSQNPADQLREAMKGASRGNGTGGAGNLSPDGNRWRAGSLRHTGRGLQWLAAALAPGDGTDLGSADSRRGQRADSQIGHGGDSLQGAAQWPSDGR
jgi:hypothetical protein